MIVNNQNQKWETHKVALCHVWNCDRLIRQDQAHKYVKPEWFGSPWAHGLDIVAICSHHIVEKGESIEVLNDKPKPLFSPESLQELSNILGDDGEVFTGKPSGQWERVEPEAKSVVKEYVFTHEVIGDDDFLYREYLEGISEGSPHRHIGGAM